MKNKIKMNKTYSILDIEPVISEKLCLNKSSGCRNTRTGLCHRLIVSEFDELFNDDALEFDIPRSIIADSRKSHTLILPVDEECAKI